MIRTYFCYDPSLHKYLHKVNKQPYLCAALHEKTGNKFWLYERNETVDELIKQFQQFMQHQ